MRGSASMRSASRPRGGAWGREGAGRPFRSSRGSPWRGGHSAAMAARSVWGQAVVVGEGARCRRDLDPLAGEDRWKKSPGPLMPQEGDGARGGAGRVPAASRKPSVQVPGVARARSRRGAGRRAAGRRRDSPARLLREDDSRWRASSSGPRSRSGPEEAGGWGRRGRARPALVTKVSRSRASAPVLEPAVQTLRIVGARRARARAPARRSDPTTTR